jgi:Protein of unknown function (DUF2934)
MSRSTTTSASAPQTAKGMQGTATMQQGDCQDKVAARAYQKWLQKGCKHGQDKQDWLEAEAEIKAEMARTGNAKR